jgi:general secretion pathway protein N
LGLGGDLNVHVSDLRISNGGADGNGTVVWRAASSALSRVSPLGNYELRFTQSGAGMTTILRTLDGPLQLEGSGSWAQSAKPAFTATARVSPEHREQLEPLLRMISVERGAGNYEFKLP